MKPKLLWVGDAVVSTGFARCTHHILEGLLPLFDISVMGLNYRGFPHKYPYDIYPAMAGGDVFGMNILPTIIDTVNPDLIVLQCDPWYVPQYMKRITNGTPVVASIAVDGDNFDARWLEVEKHFKLAIFWTQHALNQARMAGYKGAACIIPLGVDLETYHHIDIEEASSIVGLPFEKVQTSFIVGNVNRNQPRKRLDLTMRYFADWIKKEGIKDAMLMFHVSPTQEHGYDLRQLLQYYKLQGHIIFSEPPIGAGVPEDQMKAVYSLMSAQVNTGQGEGWGLTTMEGMACGVPQIVGQWSALGDWAADAAYLVPCTTTNMTPGANIIGGVPDQKAFVQALNVMYHKKTVREDAIRRGYELVKQPCYRWENISVMYGDALQQVLEGVVKEPVVVNA